MERWALPATPDSEDSGFTSPAPPEDLIYEELLTRTSWCNAEYAYRQIERGRAEGNKAALWLRSKLQSLLFTLGCYLQLHSGKALFLGFVLLGAFSVGLKLAKVETNVQKLWVEVGGRLQRELDYTEKTLGAGEGTTNQLVLQTSRIEGANLLKKEALLQHLESTKLATQVEVELDNVRWTFRDVCYISEYPSFENYLVDDIVDRLIPCTIVTPLDCFWEGAKLLGPEYPIHIPMYNNTFRWTNLDPEGLIDVAETYREIWEPMQELFNSTGIGHGYLDRPCINPQDPECPETAPNKASGQVPDIGYHLTGGCRGFAKELMEWPEELIVGGTLKNSSGYIQSAEALQTVIQLKGEQDMYNAWLNHDKVKNIRWSREKAVAVLEAWQRKFTETVRNSSSVNSTQDVNAFTSTALNDLLSEFSETSVIRVALGYGLMVLYAFITMLKIHDGVKSQGGVGLGGVVLVTMSVAASLGFCAWIGIMFNAATTQVLPFLALGVGVDDMFLLAHSSTSIPSEIPFVYYTGEVLRRAGVSVLLSSCVNICGFLSAAVIPIPALRALAFQLAIVLAFNLLVMLFVYPAMLAVDAERRETRRVDILCCITSHGPSRVIRVQPRPLCGGQGPYSQRERSRGHNTPPSRTEIEVQSAVQTVTSAPANPGGQCITVVHPRSGPVRDTMTPVYDTPPSTSASHRTLIRQNSMNNGNRSVKSFLRKTKFWRWNLSLFAKEYYGPFIAKWWAQIPILVFFSCLLAASIYGVLQMEDGLELDDVIPQDSREADFLASQSKYFSYYNMYIVSEEMADFPRRQRELYALHREVGLLDKVVRRPDGGIQVFWLEVFREWLIDMQAAFDKDKADNTIEVNTWHPNATEKGVLAYKMILQTGDPGNPIDLSRYDNGRLVDHHGIVYENAFYQYFTVWYNHEFISVAATQGNFRPTPPAWTSGGKSERKVDIPHTTRFQYTQLPFYLINLRETEEFIQLLRSVRNISDYFNSLGLKNYPRGVPFTFWEQYLHLRQYLLMAMACVFGGTFVVITILLLNPWAALIMVFVLGMITVELFGFMGLLGLKLSAIPVVTLIISVGVGVEFTLHLCLAFLTAVGDRKNRIILALEHTLAPVLDGGVSTLLGVLMLAGAEFLFIIYYFFYVFSALIILGLLNGLVLLPVLLVLFGPPGEVLSPDNGNRLRTPTPPPTPPIGRSVRMEHMGRRMHQAWDTNDHGSGSHLHEQACSTDHVEVHPPELLVETTRCNVSSVNEEYDGMRPPTTAPRSHRQPHRTRYPRHHNSFAHPHIPHQVNMTTSSSSSSPCDSPQISRHVTTVTATARVSIIHGVPCTTVEHPRHHQRRCHKHRGDAKDLPQIKDKGGGSGDSSDTAV